MAAAVAAPPLPSGRLGLALRPLQADERRVLGIGEGWVVDRLGSAATRASMQVGDVLLGVNATPVTRAEQAEGWLGGSDKVAALLVQRGANKPRR